MRKLHRWLAGLAALFAISAGVVVAQTVVTSNLAGTEFVRIQIGSVGGGDGITPSYALRSGENHTLVAATTTATTQVDNTSGIVLATGAITTWNVNLPTAPYRGQKVIIGCPGGTVTTLTITATLPSGVAIVGTNPTSCTSGGLISQGVGWTYSQSANTWYRFL